MSDTGPSVYFYDDKNGLGAKAWLFGGDEDDVEFGLFHAQAEVNAKKRAPGIEGKAGLIDFNMKDDDMQFQTGFLNGKASARTKLQPSELKVGTEFEATGSVMALGVKKDLGGGAQVKGDVDVLKSSATAEVGAGYAGYKLESKLIDTKVEIADEEVGIKASAGFGFNLVSHSAKVGLHETKLGVKVAETGVQGKLGLDGVELDGSILGTGIKVGVGKELRFKGSIFGFKFEFSKSLFD